MKAVVLESVGKLQIRDFPIEEVLGPDDVRIQIKACGICGSDIHYYKEGAIGDFVVREPMILGHEASGIVIEKGCNVLNFETGDRVCMEPGIPNFHSEEVLHGMYNLDPAVRFWATPPIHGCLRESVVHPASFCFKLPEKLSFAEGSMIEPLAIGIESATKAGIKPGDTALVVGCGTIGIMIALSALAAGCSKVFITDIQQQKLDIAAAFENVCTFNTRDGLLVDFINKATEGKGVDVLFEASGSPSVYPDFFRCAKRGAKAVLVGMMNGTVPVDVSFLQCQGISIETTFRYCNQFEKAIALIASGKIDIKSLISKIFTFDDAISAYEYAASGHADTVKVIIEL